MLAFYAPQDFQSVELGQDDIQQDQVRALYGKGLSTLEEIIESDYFPIGLIACAAARTVQRNRLFPNGLDCPIAYTITLLDDWKQQVFRTEEDVRRWKDDYSSDWMEG